MEMHDSSYCDNSGITEHLTISINEHKDECYQDHSQNDVCSKRASLSQHIDVYPLQIEKPVQVVFVVNILLCLIGVIIWLETKSYIVAAVLLHELCDIVVPIIVMYSQYSMMKNADKFPAGRTRLEPVAILICALIMIEVSISVIYFASDQIYRIFTHKSEFIIDADTFSILGMIVCIILNLTVWIFCKLFSSSPSIMTLAIDSRNDVLGDLVAFTAVCLISYFGKYYWIDPIGAICVSLFIISSWYKVGLAETNKLLGITCNDKYRTQINDFIKHETNSDDYRLIIYHIGRNLLIEVKLILLDSIEYNQLCDLCNDLQHKLEEFHFVERAFVGFDSIKRDIPLHKIPSLGNMSHVPVH